MEIYLENSKGQPICFKHAVKEAIEKNENISIHSVDDKSCGQSGSWWTYGCVECENEIG